MASRVVVLLVVAAACVLGAADAKLGRLVVTGVVPCNTGSLIDIATSPAFPSTYALTRPLVTASRVHR